MVHLILQRDHLCTKNSGILCVSSRDIRERFQFVNLFEIYSYEVYQYLTNHYFTVVHQVLNTVWRYFYQKKKVVHNIYLFYI